MGCFELKKKTTMSKHKESQVRVDNQEGITVGPREIGTMSRGECLVCIDDSNCFNPGVT
jgi:hypothetical protein